MLPDSTVEYNFNFPILSLVCIKSLKGKNMKKILLVMYSSFDKGGVQNVAMNIVRSMHDEYLFDAFVISEKAGFYDSEFLSYGGSLYKRQYWVEKHEMFKRFSFYLRGSFLYKTVRRIIETNGPYCAIHCNIVYEAGIVLGAAKRCGVPVRIAHSHTAFNSRYNLVARMYIAFLRKLISKNATNLIACSYDAGRSLFGNEQFMVVYNTIDRKFLENKPVLSQLFTAPRLLQVGLICENKNQLFSIRVLHALKKYYKDSSLTIIGMPKDSEMELYYSDIVGIVKKLGMASSVRFLPADADVCEEMRHSTYLVFPSKHEGLGIVAIEAQSLGLKCFVSDSVTHEVDCGGCEFIDLNQGAETWAEIIHEHFEADRGERGKYDISRFFPDVIMQMYRTIYSGSKLDNHE